MSLQDKIGRKSFVDKICGLADSLGKDQNFCLSINGAWGSGKTFVLKMIEEQLSTKQEYIIVKYDAWKNSFYSDPLIAMLYCVLDTLEHISSVVTEKRVATVAKEQAKQIASAATMAIAEKSKIAQVVTHVFNGIRDIIRAYKNTSLTVANEFDNYKSYSTLLNNIIGLLNEITASEIVSEKQTKLVILVDEIDRCLPNEQLKILERLHHLFDVKNCAVIVAMNQASIAQTVKTIYGINGNEYLRKFFDFSFKLETSASEYLNSLLGDFVKSFEKLQSPTNEQEFPVRLAYQCLLYGGNKVLDKVDNREMSRFYDGLLNVCNDFGWERLSQRYVFFIIIGLFIRKNISHTFLSESEIIDNQERIFGGDIQRETLDFSSRQEMPYYDYLLEYLGMDRENLPESIVQLYRWGDCHIPEFSWDFNEIVCYSVSSQQYNYNQLRRFQGQKPIIVDDCKELRRLVILYGGEQER